MRKNNKKPEQKLVGMGKTQKTEKRKIDDRFVTKCKSKNPASWQNLGFDALHTNARRSSIT